MIDMNRMTFSSYAGAARIALATLVCLFPLASNAADSMPARTPIIRAGDFNGNFVAEWSQFGHFQKFTRAT